MGEGGGREGADIRGIQEKRWVWLPKRQRIHPSSCRLPHPFLTRNLPWHQVELFPLSLW